MHPAEGPGLVSLRGANLYDGGGGDRFDETPPAKQTEGT
jgi:hypothetical protein